MGSTIIFHWFAQAISVMRAVQSLLDPHGQDHLLHARVAAVAHVSMGVKKRGCSSRSFYYGNYTNYTTQK
jgi:hypothetical protein